MSNGYSGSYINNNCALHIQGQMFVATKLKATFKWFNITPTTIC